MNPIPAVAASLLIALAGCGTSSNGNGASADAGPDASCYDAGYACGNPCDVGNSLGVGQFCNVLQDCFNNSKARLCATLGNPMEHFCTFVCTAPDAGGAPDQCGEAASCQCQGGQCGCFPDRCK